MRNHIVFVLITIIFIYSASSYACKCKRSSTNENEAITEAYNLYKKIVIAKSIEVNPLDTREWYNKLIPFQDHKIRHEEVQFDVLHTFKGAKTDKVITQTYTGCCACGLKVKQGETYLLYLWDSKPTSENEVFSLSYCSRTKIVNNCAKELEILNQLSPNKYHSEQCQ